MNPAAVSAFNYAGDTLRQLLDQDVEIGRIRQPGAGRKPVEKKRPK